MTSRGRFITLEGVDGAGKSTHTGWIADFLRAQGLEVVATREPGGTPLGEKLRALVLNDPMGLDTETLLMFAARCEHARQVIEPALARGLGGLRPLYRRQLCLPGRRSRPGAERVAALEAWMQAGQPDRTWLFDVPLEVARQRADAREPDRFEREARPSSSAPARPTMIAPRRIRTVSA